MFIGTLLSSNGHLVLRQSGIGHCLSGTHRGEAVRMLVVWERTRGFVESAIGEPTLRRCLCALDQLGCPGKIVGADRKRTNRWDDSDPSSICVAFGVVHELSHDQQIESMQRHLDGAPRWPIERTGEPGRKHDDPASAESYCCRDGRVAGDAAVNE